MTKNEIVKVEKLLAKVNKIRQKAYEEAETKEENFNIFQILKLETDEVRLHTRFIIELLNPKGKHGLGIKPLENLLRILLNALNDLEIDQNSKTKNTLIKTLRGSINKLKTDNISALITIKVGSKYLGKKRRENHKYMGGEIDIAIELESLCIAIENKIEAKDQVKQLSRYYNSLKNGNKELLLLYLTLDGNEPSKQSAGDLIKNSNYFLLSYKRHIISWLTLCHNAASDKPILRETIKQYKILIEKLTGQLTHQKMNEKLIKLISNNYEDSKLIYQNFKKAQNEIKVNIMKKVLSNLTADSALKKYNINKNLDTEKAPHISIRNQTWREGLLAYLEHNNGKSFFEIGIVNIGEKLSDLEKENLKKGENLKSENWITSKKTYLYEYTLTNTQENISEIANQLTTKLLKVLNDDKTNWTI